MTPHLAPRVTITSITFRGYKAFSQYSVSLQHLNVLVGPNNCGKSTVIGALRALAVGVRKARSRRPEFVEGPEGPTSGYWLEEHQLPISLENVHTNYADEDSVITFRLSNSNQLLLFFPKAGGCALIPKAQGRPIRDTAGFRREFPLTIAVVPILGPVEHNEPLLDEETVRRNLETHRASRNFRNYWHQNPEGFESFAELVRDTWRGLDVLPPERVAGGQNTLVMFCLENRMSRELYWAGFGFQVWCQLLTHVSRSAGACVLVVDEPEVYLHPDVQRQLLGILRRIGPDVILATHSTEIIGEADPSDVLLIDKNERAASRLRDASGVQSALDTIGSIQNITLTSLARTQRLLFVEDESDIRTLRRFALKLGLSPLSVGIGYTVAYSGGFSSWDRIQALAWGFKHTFRIPIQIGAVFDRDYWPQEETESILGKLQQELGFAVILRRKEMENYLLVPKVLGRAISGQLEDKVVRGVTGPQPSWDLHSLLEEVTAPQRAGCQSQYIAKRLLFFRSSQKDPATITNEAIAWFDGLWGNVSTRMTIVPGKATLSSLRGKLKERWDIAVSDARIIESFQPEDIPHDLVDVLTGMDAFRRPDA